MTEFKRAIRGATVALSVPAGPVCQSLYVEVSHRDAIRWADCWLRGRGAHLRLHYSTTDGKPYVMISGGVRE